MCSNIRTWHKCVTTKSINLCTWQWCTKQRWKNWHLCYLISPRVQTDTQDSDTLMEFLLGWFKNCFVESFNYFLCIYCVVSCFCVGGFSWKFDRSPEIIFCGSKFVPTALTQWHSPSLSMCKPHVQEIEIKCMDFWGSKICGYSTNREKNPLYSIRSFANIAVWTGTLIVQ